METVFITQSRFLFMWGDFLTYLVCESNEHFLPGDRVELAEMTDKGLPLTGRFIRAIITNVEILEICKKPTLVVCFRVSMKGAKAKVLS